MKNISNLIYKDPQTMENISKIINGLWDGTIKLINSPDNTSIFCKIGNHCMYPIKNIPNNLKSTKIRNKYDIFTVAQIILTSIFNLCNEEYIECCDILNF